jgi:hypothetical protein
MEIKELVSFYINESSQTLDVTFRTLLDSDDEIRTSQIEFSEIKNFGYDVLLNKIDEFENLIDEDEIDYDDFDDLYDDKAIINVTTKDVDGTQIPSAIHFETATGDFVNDYRLMAKNIVEDKVKAVTFKGTKWDVEFEPTTAGILRLKKQASANSEELTFTTKTDGTDLKIFFGDPSTHSGNFVFQQDVTGTLTRPWNWPVKVFLAIMDLPGDKTVRFADAGAAEIVVDSGLATWTYLLPAQAK